MNNFRIVTVAVCWLVIGASPDQAMAIRKPDVANQANEEVILNIAAAIERANQAKPQDLGCQDGKDDLSSDLCAQWKAAIAANDSAVWTGRSFWLALLGTFIGGFTLVAAGFAAWYAKEAAKHTESGAIEASRAAKAAEEALAHEKRMSELDFRPWLAVRVELEDILLADQFITFQFRFYIQNFGKSVAHNVVLTPGLFFMGIDDLESKIENHRKNAATENIVSRTIIPNDSENLYCPIATTTVKALNDNGYDLGAYVVPCIAISCSYEFADQTKHQTFKAFVVHNNFRKGGDKRTLLTEIQSKEFNFSYEQRGRSYAS